MTDDLTQKLLAKSYKDTSRLAEIIRDYNPTLELRWIPDAVRGTEDVFPYCIVQNLREFLLGFLILTIPSILLARFFDALRILSERRRSGKLPRQRKSRRKR